MGEYFKDKEQMYECFGTLFEKMRFDERTGGRSEVGGRADGNIHRRPPCQSPNKKCKT